MGETIIKIALWAVMLGCAVVNTRGLIKALKERREANDRGEERQNSV